MRFLELAGLTTLPSDPRLGETVLIPGGDSCRACSDTGAHHGQVDGRLGPRGAQ